MKKYTPFPLFSSHLDLAHHYWRRLLSPGDTAIDATCGNGHDTLAIAKLLEGDGENEIRLIAIDIQEKAIEATKSLLSQQLKRNIRFIHGSHAKFPDDIEPQSVALIIYNLGYLPGGDKTKTTLTSSTLESLGNALPLIKAGGAISITCYPGHEEGKAEEEKVLAFASALDPRIWSCCHHRWLNRRDAPSLLLIQKTITSESAS